MSITMPDGRTYTYLSDGLMINGRRVREARVDGALVYPREEWPYWVRCSMTIDYHHKDDDWVLAGGKYTVVPKYECRYHIEESVSVWSRLPIRVWRRDMEVKDDTVLEGKRLYPMDRVNLEPTGVPNFPARKVMRSSFDIRWSANGFFGDQPERHASAEGAGYAYFRPPREWGIGDDPVRFASIQIEGSLFYLSLQLPGHISRYDNDACRMSLGLAGHVRYRHLWATLPDGQPMYYREDWDQTCAIEHSPSPWATDDEYRAAFLSALAAL